MKRMHWTVAGVILVTCGIGGHSVDARDDGPFLGASDPATAASFQGYKCIARSSCPEGLIIANPNGNHAGCVVISEWRGIDDAGCEGTCLSCSGTNGQTYVCTSSSGATCTSVAPVRIVSCGLLRKHERGCFQSAPTGTPSTPNGCDCHTDTPFVYSGDGCSIQECN